MSFEKAVKSSSTRHKAREAALQMLVAADLYLHDPQRLTDDYWNELGDTAIDTRTREFSDKLVHGALKELSTIDDRIRTRAWAVATLTCATWVLVSPSAAGRRRLFPGATAG